MLGDTSAQQTKMRKPIPSFHQCLTGRKISRQPLNVFPRY